MATLNANGTSPVGGTSGADLITGDAANNVISAGGGNDIVNAGAGNDRVGGGNGNDILNGEDGDDTLSGDAGFDNLDGGRGNDTLTGGSDADKFHFHFTLTEGAPDSVDGHDTITDFLATNDRLVFHTGVAFETSSETGGAPGESGHIPSDTGPSGAESGGPPTESGPSEADAERMAFFEAHFTVDHVKIGERTNTIISAADGSWDVKLLNVNLTTEQVLARIDFII